MIVELDDECYTLDCKFRLVPVSQDVTRKRRIGDIKIEGDITEEFERAGKEIEA